MPVSLLDRAIQLLTTPAAKLAAKKITREEAVQKILFRLHIPISPPPDDFDTIYVRALVECGAAKPTPVLNLWRNELIRSAFRRSFDTGDPSILRHEVETIVQLNDETHFLGHIDYDLRQEIEQFANTFDTLVSSTRTAPETRRERTLNQVLNTGQETATNVQRILSTIRELHQQTSRRLPPTISQVLLPPPSLLPQHYIARTNLLERLKTILQISPQISPDQWSSKVVALVGIGGTGKSVLAAALSCEHDVPSRYPAGVLWVDLPIQGLPIQEILLEFHSSAHAELPPSLSPNSLSQLLRSTLATKPRLVILDDAASPEGLEFLIQSVSGVSSLVLITRQPEIPARLGIVEVLNVSGLEPQEARLLVEKRLNAPLADSEWNTTVQPFLARLGFHPLSTALAAAQVSFGTTRWSILSTIVAGGQLASAVDFSDPHTKTESLNLTFEHTFNSLEPRAQRELLWLSTLAVGQFFSLPDAAMVLNGMPEIATLAQTTETPLGTEFSSEWIEKQTTYTSKALDHLVRRGILERVQQVPEPLVYRFHPVLHALALERLKTSPEYSHAITHHAWVYLSLMTTQQGVPAPMHLYTLTHAQILEVLDRAWATLDDLDGIKLPTREMAQQAILAISSALSDHWSLRGELDQKAKWASRALAVAQQVANLEAEHEFHVALAQVSLTRGELTRSEYHYRSAIKISKTLHNDLYHKMDLAALAMVEQASGNNKSAIERLKRCETFFRKSGDDHSLGIVLGALGNAHAGLDEFDHAISYLERALEIASNEQDALAYGSRLGNLAATYQLRARRDTARALPLLHQSRYMAWHTGNVMSEANRLLNLAEAYTATWRLRLARLCAEQAHRLYSQIGSPRAKYAEALIASIDGTQHDEPESLSTPDIYQLAEAAVQGDKIAEYRLERYTDVLIRHRAEIPDVARILDSIRQVLRGERNPNNVLAGIADADSINLRVLLMNLDEPGSGNFLSDSAVALRGLLTKEPAAREALQHLLPAPASPDHLPAPLRGLHESLQRALNGETDISVLVEPIGNDFVQATFRVMLSLGTPVFDPAAVRIAIHPQSQR